MYQKWLFPGFVRIGRTLFAALFSNPHLLVPCDSWIGDYFLVNVVVFKKQISTWGEPGIPKTRNLSKVVMSLLTCAKVPPAGWKVLYFLSTNVARILYLAGLFSFEINEPNDISSNLVIFARHVTHDFNSLKNSDVAADIFKLELSWRCKWSIKEVLSLPENTV